MPPKTMPLSSTIPPVAASNHQYAIGIGGIKVHTNMQPKAASRKNEIANTTPNPNPSLVLATIHPTIPPIRTTEPRTTETSQCVQTPSEQRTATKSVNSKSDRRLN